MKKHVHFLLILLLVSSLLVASAGAYLKYDLFVRLDIETEENIIALPFVACSDQMLIFTINNRMERLNDPVTDSHAAADDPLSSQSPENADATTPEQTEPVTEPVYTPVDESWFDDALFIGESRTLGLSTAGRLGDADYFCSQSLRVFDVMKVRCSDEDFHYKTLAELLEENTYGKIYIHFGINECYGDVDIFIAQYQELIDMIRSYQPDAYIMLQAIMPVSRDYARSEDYQPANLAIFNQAIASLCVDDHIRFIDASEWYADEDGYLREELTWDGCHLYIRYYPDWANWFVENAGWLGIP